MPSPWLAVGAQTDPLGRARQLQSSWERLLAEGALAPDLPPEATAGLRPTIVDSWRRSLATGLNPTGLLAPIEAGRREMRERWLEHPLGSVAHVLAAELRLVAEESESLVVVTDASGLVLHVDGAEWLKERAIEMNLVEGARYSEVADGTNGIGTALAADHPCQVFAFEHFNERHHQWVCSGAPVHDPVSGRPLGLIDLSSIWKIAHPRSLELVTRAASTVEEYLLRARRDQDARLRRRYCDLMTKSTDLLVSRSGYVLDGDGSRRATRLEGSLDRGEIVLADGSVAIAEPLGHGEAYLLRRPGSRSAKATLARALERAEVRAHELAAEQAALRQIATLVARESSLDPLLTVVANQVATIFEVPVVVLSRYEQNGTFVVLGGFNERLPVGSRWPYEGSGVTELVYRSGRPSRVQDYAHFAGDRAAAMVRSGVRSAVGSPIVVEGRVWGVMAIGSPEPGSFPQDTEARLTDFAELVATAIANAESRGEVSRLAEEQAALRRVATLVANGLGPEEVFPAVAHAVKALFDADMSAVVRFEPDEMATVLADLGGPNVDGQRVTLNRGYVVWAVRDTGRPARFDTDDPAAADLPEFVQARGIRSGLASPIIVNGELWGAVTAASTKAAMPPDAESRIAQFTQLLGTAVSNTESRSELAASEAQARELAREQAALRRVATRVAEGTGADELFAAVAHEVADVLDIPAVTLERIEADGTFTVVGTGGETSLTVGSSWPIEDEGLAGRILATGRPARREGYSTMPGPLGAAVRDDGVTSKVGVPIVVEGSVWGFMIGGARTEKPIPDGTEERLARFTELVATAIANSHAREQVAQLANEQAALRRVATMVAQGGTPAAVFAALAAEMEALLDAHGITLCRYEPGNELTVLAHRGPGAGQVPPGTRVRHDGNSVSATVRQTHRPARMDTYATTGGHIGHVIEGLRFSSGVGAPIIVDGRLWGTMIANWVDETHPPPDTEERVAKFTELVATAIANTQAQEQLVASRARIVASADETRRQIVRDLHDGAQERLVHTIITLKLAQRAQASRDEETARALVGEALDHAERTNSDLHELVHGILPGSLTRSGLEVGVKELASRVRIPVGVSVPQDRFPAEVEANAYFVIAEALTNVTKHAGAENVEVSGWAEDGALHLEVRDDGVGGARADGGGLRGLSDRVGALGGQLSVHSPSGGGTRVAATLPLER